MAPHTFKGQTDRQVSPVAHELNFGGGVTQTSQLSAMQQQTLVAAGVLTFHSQTIMRYREGKQLLLLCCSLFRRKTLHSLHSISTLEILECVLVWD